MIFKLVMSLVIDKFLLFCALRPCRQQKQIGAAFMEPEIMTFCISLQTREMNLSRHAFMKAAADIHPQQVTRCCNQ